MMRAQVASISAIPGRENEDFAAVTSNAAVVLDGAGTPAGSESGCIHGVAWYSRMLGSTLVRQLANVNQDMADGLADAIREVAALHSTTCNLDHPGSPSSTVTAVRERGATLEYLVLADSPLVLDLPVGPKVIWDNREAIIGSRYRTAMDSAPNGSAMHTAALREYVEMMRRHRNQPDGFWVASSDPNAAEQALTGSFKTAEVKAAVLLSDGASRLVDRFNLMSWATLLTTLTSSGPTTLLRQVRAAESSDPAGSRWPRGKATDDATIVCATPERIS